MDIQDNPPPSSNPEPDNKPTTTTPIGEPDYTLPEGKGKFRFKSKSSSRSKSSQHDSHYHRRHKHSDRHRHDDHRSSKRRKTKKPRSPSPNTIPSYPGPPLSPNTAFRESLFDAMGDDEGAAFWESVYGQPIHTYHFPSEHGHGNEHDDRGDLERMTEDEYATYVRSEMWKRTREGMIEEQERLKAEKRAKARAERLEEEKEERRAFERAMEESLRRGRERRRMQGVWKGVWADYLGAWHGIESLRNKSKGEGEDEGGEGREKVGKRLQDLIFWPVESGRRRDVTKETVAEFMRHAPRTTQVSSDDGHGGKDSSGSGAGDFLATLKAERVRWHPDKIQHRYGALGIGETVMRSVTEVFQIIDDLWNDVKK